MQKITINVKSDIYKEFQEICRAKGVSVAVELRLYMAKIVEENK